LVTASALQTQQRANAATGVSNVPSINTKALSNAVDKILAALFGKSGLESVTVLAGNREIRLSPGMSIDSLPQPLSDEQKSMLLVQLNTVLRSGLPNIITQVKNGIARDLKLSINQSTDTSTAQSATAAAKAPAKTEAPQIYAGTNGNNIKEFLERRNGRVNQSPNSQSADGNVAVSQQFSSKAVAQLLIKFSEEQGKGYPISREDLAGLVLS